MPPQVAGSSPCRRSFKTDLHASPFSPPKVIFVPQTQEHRRHSHLFHRVFLTLHSWTAVIGIIGQCPNNTNGHHNDPPFRTFCHRSKPVILPLELANGPIQSSRPRPLQLTKLRLASHSFDYRVVLVVCDKLLSTPKIKEFRALEPPLARTQLHKSVSTNTCCRPPRPPCM